MCLFHKWEKTFSKNETLTKTAVFTGVRTEEEIIIVIEKCSKCGKEKTYMKNMMGKKEKLDLDYVKHIMGMD